MKCFSCLNIFVGVVLLGSHSLAVEPRSADQILIRQDLRRILSDGQLPAGMIDFEVSRVSTDFRVAIDCNAEKMTLRVYSSAEEWSATFYYGLQKLGFLFPHPRMQVTPTVTQIFGQCGQVARWKPRFKFRGFHLHTEHPNEWVHGFLMDETKIAEDLIRWLVRNGQNVLQIKLLKNGTENWVKHLAPLLNLAHDMGVVVGLDVAFASLQQKAFRLLDIPYFLAILSSATGAWDEKTIQNTILRLNRELPFDYLSADMGTTEFTPTNFDRTLSWIETARQSLAKLNRDLFLKAHVSVGQDDPRFGNFNFLSQFSDTRVGVEPHTVMFYGLRDSNAPVYGRTDFKDLISFMEQEASRRTQWYFPETSYWVGIDIDIPLLLTDFLMARSDDMDVVEKIGLQGHVDFTSGQELGYWLMDWTVALLNNSEYRDRPLIGLEMLGESKEVWQSIADFQSRHFKKNGLLAILSSANLMDELPGFSHRVLARHTMKELSRDPKFLRAEISLLETALNERPSIEGIKNVELKALMRVTWLRVEHALNIRRALLFKVGDIERNSALHKALVARELAKAILENTLRVSQRYPEAKTTERHKNLTSYDYGYLWTARTLHFWEREEGMIRTNNYSPFFMNIYNPLETIF